MEIFVKICGAITAMAAVFVLLRKIYFWWKPASATISYKLVLNNSGPDTISIHITNKSQKNIYVKSCELRSTYSLFQLAKMHLQKPFLSLSLYPNLRYNGCVYQFVEGDPVKIESHEMKTLTIDIYEHPLNAIYGPRIIAFVELTTGQKICTERMESPQVWRLIGERNRNIRSQSYSN